MHQVYECRSNQYHNQSSGRTLSYRIVDYVQMNTTRVRMVHQSNHEPMEVPNITWTYSSLWTTACNAIEIYFFQLGKQLLQDCIWWRSCLISDWGKEIFLKFRNVREFSVNKQNNLPGFVRKVDILKMRPESRAAYGVFFLTSRTCRPQARTELDAAKLSREKNSSTTKEHKPNSRVEFLINSISYPKTPKLGIKHSASVKRSFTANDRGDRIEKDTE